MSEEKQEVSVGLNNEVAEAVNGGNIADLLASKNPMGFSLTSEYLKMEKGEKDRFAVAGFNTMTVKDEDSEDKNATKDIEVVLLIDSKGSTKVAAQTVIVNSLKNANQTFVEIHCKGEIKMGGKKSYTGFDIFPLN